MDNTVQGTPEWHEARRGKVTASRIADVMAKTKSGYSASRVNYMAELTIQILTGEVAEGYTNAAMAWGVENEQVARSAYEFYTGRKVTQVGFIHHPEIPSSGASPDGLVDDDGLIEIKCPNSATHLNTLLTGKIDRKYLLQMQWQMDCTGRKWCDFVSYDPRFPEHMSVFIQRVERDEDLTGEIRSEVGEFLTEMNGNLETLKGKYKDAASCLAI